MAQVPMWASTVEPVKLAVLARNPHRRLKSVVLPVLGFPSSASDMDRNGAPAPALAGPGEALETDGSPPRSCCEVVAVIDNRVRRRAWRSLNRRLRQRYVNLLRQRRRQYQPCRIHLHDAPAPPLRLLAHANLAAIGQTHGVEQVAIV